MINNLIKDAKSQPYLFSSKKNELNLLLRYGIGYADLALYCCSPKTGPLELDRMAKLRPDFALLRPRFSHKSQESGIQKSG